MIPPFGVSSYKYDKTFLTKTDLFDYLNKKQYLSPSFKKDFWGELSKRGYKETQFETAAFEELEKIAQIILQKSFLEKKFESQSDFIPSPVKDYDKKIDADFNIQLQELENHGFPSAAAHKIRLGFHYFSIMENYYLKKPKLSQNEKANLLFQIRTRQQLYWMNLVFGDLNTLIKEAEEAEEADRELNSDRITNPPLAAEEAVSFPPLITPNSINTYAIPVSKNYRETVSGVVEVLTPGNSSQKHKDVLAKGKNGEPVYALIDIKAANGIKIQDPALLKDELFHNVLNGVFSLYHAGFRSFTIPQLYRVCTQQTGRNRPHDSALARYEAIIEKMRVVSAEVDYSQEAQSWGYKKTASINSWKTEGSILFLLKDTVEIVTGKNGKTTKVTQYRFRGEPLLYDYSKNSGQIRYIPFEKINTTGVLSNTTDVIVLREFLLRMIEQGKKMIEQRKKSTIKIKFDTIYTRVNSRADRTQQKRIRDNTEKILSCFKKNGYIAAYKKYGPPGKEYGYEITPSPADTKK
jgi:hypothetical protein